jgi:hypothetical protein
MLCTEGLKLSPDKKYYERNNQEENTTPNARDGEHEGAISRDPKTFSEKGQTVNTLDLESHIDLRN